MTGPHLTRPHIGRAPPHAVTLHSRIRDELREHIASGAWQPLDRVPSESTLMSQYGVSRITVRHALAHLERERLIFKVPGKGSFVAQPKPYQELGRLQGLAEAMAERGHEVSNRLAGLRHLPAPREVAERLRMAGGAPVTQIERVRCLDGLPVSLDVTWVPRSVGERLEREDLRTRDIFAILERDFGLPLGHADLALDATLADERLAGLLDIPAGSPVLRVERLTHSRDGHPLDFEHLFCRSDRFQFRLQLQRD